MKKQAIVTGASSGIGYATALQLAQSSIQVLGVARREEELKQLEQEHQNIHTIAVDLLEDQAYKKISQYYKKIKKIDYIVISAGQAGPFMPLLDIDLINIKETLSLDILSPLLLTQALSNYFNQTRLLFIGSYSAQIPRHNWGVYSIGKAAQLMMARCLQKENQRLQVGIFLPGAVQTAIYNSAVSKTTDVFPDQPAYQHFIDTNTVKTPEECAANICEFLINSSDDAFSKLKL